MLQTETHQLRSMKVVDEFVIDVHLPVSYPSCADSFPVLVVLDADKSSGMARDTVDWLSWSKEIPELIAVGISYGGSEEEWWQKRSRDLTPSEDKGMLWGDWPLAGGARKFKAFLREEFFPFLESSYRINADRTLAGVSFGGLFAAYILFTDPTLFNRYIMVNPALAWDKEKLWPYEQDYRSKSTNLTA